MAAIETKKLKLQTNFMRLLLILFTGLVLLSIPFAGGAQRNTSTNTMFRFYEDNDFINLRGSGTDEAYTNGTRLDIFYEKENANKKFLNRWMPKAGKNAINTYGWGIMQLMYTPRDISTSLSAPKDYNYAGALFAIKSLHSSNARKKYSLHTELYLGTIGPNSFAKESQIAIHKLINYQRPNGWDNQVSSKFVLNINLTAEKMLFQKNNSIELIGGSKIMAGTMTNAISLYSLLRVGKMNPYFNGFINRYHTATIKSNAEQWQANVIFRPVIEYQFFNTLISGNRIKNNSNKAETDVVKSEISAKPVPNHFIYGFDYGFSLTCNTTTLAITQKVESAAIQGVRHHEVGNILFLKNLQCNL